jgi:peptide-methionine (S)-S-oxide reductase
MNPFATLRARALITGGLVIATLAAIPILGRKGGPAVSAFVAYPMLLGWAVWLARRHGVDLRRLAGPRVSPDQVVVILALVPALVALDVGIVWLVYTPVSWVSPEGVRSWLERMERLTPGRLEGPQELLFLVGAVAVAPVVEEFIFRGLLFHRWALKWGTRGGLLATTAAFALLHASPVNAFLLGFGFALIYLRTGSLPLTMAAHGLNNLIALELLPRLGPPGEPGGDLLAEFHQGTAQALVLFFAGATILWLGRHWYWPDPIAPMPYDRGLPAPLSSECEVPSAEGSGAELGGSVQPVELGIQDQILTKKPGVANGSHMAMAREVATLAGGCFWCLEAAFQQLEGVDRVTSGYAGGALPDPSYEAVCTGATGHAEVVQLDYDPSRIGFRELLEVFFTIHDPTTRDRQGADIGTQYRSAIFYHTPEQRAVAEQTIAEFNTEDLWGAPIVTEVVPLDHFYPAEAYHHDYFRRNPYQPYCLAVVAPKVAKVRSRYAARLKK